MLIASTPVSAAHPEENARASRKTAASPLNTSCPGSDRTSKSALSAIGRFPVLSRIRPQIAIPMIDAMKMYVGTAKIPPDSRTPRRFIAVSSRTRPTASGTSWPWRNGNADLAFWTPDEIDTATVKT